MHLVHILNTIFRIVRSKFFIATVVFFVLMLFYDKNDVFVQMDRQKQLEELKEGQAFYEKEIAKLQKQLTELEANPANLQTYARENLFMKKADEDIFIVEPAKDSTAKK